MALQIRRGLEADRLSITPLAGELLYVTDTGNVYVGDGTTAGGALVTGDVADDTSPQLGGDLDLNGNDIIGTGNINITGTITATGNINLGDESADNISVVGSLTTNLTPAQDSTVDIGTNALRWRNGYFAGLTVDGQIDAISINSRLLADDSTISFDPSSGVFDGTFVGNLTGNANGSHTGTFTGNVIGTLDGDVTGSVFGDDSTPIIDGINGTFSGNIVGSSTMSATTASEVQFNIDSLDNTSRLNLRRLSASDLTGNTGVQYGTISFGRNDANGLLTTGLIFGRENAIFFGNSSTGNFGVPSAYMVWRDNKFGIGLTTPAEVLDVAGNAKVSGTVTAAGFVGSVFADDSATIVDGITGSVTAQSFVQFGSLTTAERDALTASNGMVIYNSTDNKFQGYENGSWVNLV